MTRPPRIAGTYTSKSRVLLVLNSIGDDLEPNVKSMLATRNACMVDGACPACGATPELHLDDEYEHVAHLVFEHEPACPALPPEHGLAA